MSLNLDAIKQDAPKSKKNYGRLEDGTHLARIVSIVDFGLQPQTDYDTKEPSDPKKTVMITFETPEERIDMEDKEGNKVSKPRWIGKEVKQSMHEKSTLFKIVNAVGKGISSLDELLNKPVMITVESTKTGNAKVTGENKPMKGMEVGELENEATFFDFDSPNLELFKSLPAWQQNKIKEALNFDQIEADLVEKDEF